jgi:hypothetical protein
MMAVKQGNADCGSDTLREFCIQKPILDIVKVEFMISAAKVQLFWKMCKIFLIRFAYMRKK